MTTSRQELGDLGERLAARFLRRLGHKILARKYRCPAGEIDLISFDPSARCICFIEVKTARSPDADRPEDQVNRAKRRRVLAAAGRYLRAKRAFEYATRFDVIAVIDPAGEGPQIRHWPDAFRR